MEVTTMKRKKFLALALAGVMTAATLTACAPLEDLYDWFLWQREQQRFPRQRKGPCDGVRGA